MLDGQSPWEKTLSAQEGTYRVEAIIFILLMVPSLLPLLSYMNTREGGRGGKNEREQGKSKRESTGEKDTHTSMQMKVNVSSLQTLMNY